MRHRYALVTATAATWQADHGTFKVTGASTPTATSWPCCTVNPDVEVFVTTIS